MTAIGPDVETPEINAVLTKGNLEILVDLDGLIDPAAEVKRLEKEIASLEKSIGGKQRQLSNEKFVAAKPELAEEIRGSLKQVEEQIEILRASLEKMKGKLR